MLSYSDLLVSDMRLSDSVLMRESRASGRPSEELTSQMGSLMGEIQSEVERGMGGVNGLLTLNGDEAAKLLCDSMLASIFGPGIPKMMAYATAAALENAGWGRIVKFPTGGACGVVAGLVCWISEAAEISQSDVVKSLFAAAGVGQVIASRATFSGAVATCTAEIGSAAAMGAAFLVDVLGGDPQTAEWAAAQALHSLTISVCRPILGAVEIPCVQRNATGAVIAAGCAYSALCGIPFPLPLDEVIDEFNRFGRDFARIHPQEVACDMPCASKLKDEAIGRGRNAE